MLEPALPPALPAALPDEWLIRLGSFVAVFVLVATWELLAPRRIPAIGRRTRWPSNLGVVALNTVLVRVLTPMAPAAFALLGQARGWGLFNQVELPAWAVFVLSVAALDLAIYFQHVLFHAVPALWRLHRMHHADLEFDVTTGLRFHPLEIALSTAIKFAVVAALGAPASAVVLFEVLLNGISMFNHGNVCLPARADRVLRYVVVTPEMHRIHHSIARAETDSNFGFNLPWWDRMLGTYRAQPAAGHERMTIGIDRFRDPADLRLDRMLLQPFHDDGAASVPHANSTAS